MMYKPDFVHQNHMVSFKDCDDWFLLPGIFPYWVWHGVRQLGFPRWCNSKESACQCRRHLRCGFNSWVEKMPWSRKWQVTPVFLPGKSHRQKSLAGYIVHGVSKSRTRLSAHTHTHENIENMNIGLFPLASWPWACSVQSLSHVRLFPTPWTAAHHASLSITNSWSLLKLRSIKPAMPSNHLILRACKTHVNS